jgi:hypothetical protein
MAINFFRSVALDLTTSTEVLYTTPAGFTGIVLMAQVTNISGSTASIRFGVLRESQETNLAFDFEIPSQDSAGMLTGKLVLESGESLFGSASSNNQLQMVLSILESQN